MPGGNSRNRRHSFRLFTVTQLISKTSTSYRIPEYDQLVTGNKCSMCHSVCKVTGKAQFCFFLQRNTSPTRNSKLNRHHDVPEVLGMLSCSLNLKMQLVSPPLPRSSYVPSSFRFILQCLFWQSVCPSSVHVVATFPGTVLYPLLCSVLQSCA